MIRNQNISACYVRTPFHKRLIKCLAVFIPLFIQTSLPSFAQSSLRPDSLIQSALDDPEFIELVMQDSTFLCNESLVLTDGMDTVHALFFRGRKITRFNPDNDSGCVTLHIEWEVRNHRIGYCVEAVRIETTAGKTEVTHLRGICITLKKNDGIYRVQNKQIQNITRCVRKT